MLSSINAPEDLADLDHAQLAELAREIREFLVAQVSQTGGHLGPNLGVVELTLALHRVFRSPTDRILWDTGHQSYVHKILTGRQADFATLRQRDGLSGYPSQAESEHDIIENSHASTALSYADGLAKAYALQGEQRHVVAVVGDGALTGGMCWEALNNIAAAKDRPLVIVVNDNGRSYSPTIGGVADRLASLRLQPGYENLLTAARQLISNTPVVGPSLYDALHGIKRGIKDILSPQGLFEDLGLKYVGPVDGHNIAAVESALRLAKGFGRTVLVHCVTRKGFGYPPAEDNVADCLHGTGVFDPETGKAVRAAAPSWTSVFSDELVQIGEQRPDVVAITAAMAAPTGLSAFANAFPDRCFDVGIAEQHALTSAAGLALGGLHPVVALYATFLNRAFDQMLMDVALHRLPVTVVLDRAGITGDDGASHHGVWDLSMLGAVPGLRLAAPRDEVTLRAELQEAIAHEDGPTVLRYPKTALGKELPAIRQINDIDVLAEPLEKSTETQVDALIVAVGSMAQACVDVAQKLAVQGINCTVVDPRWVLPVPQELVKLAMQHRLAVCVEDGLRTGGIGSQFAQLLADHNVQTPCRSIGIPREFLAHGRVDQLHEDIGLTPRRIARQITEWVSSLADEQSPESHHNADADSVTVGFTPGARQHSD